MASATTCIVQAVLKEALHGADALLPPVLVISWKVLIPLYEAGTPFTPQDASRIRRLRRNGSGVGRSARFPVLVVERVG